MLTILSKKLNYIREFILLKNHPPPRLALLHNSPSCSARPRLTSNVSPRALPPVDAVTPVGKLNLITWLSRKLKKECVSSAPTASSWPGSRRAWRPSSVMGGPGSLPTRTTDTASPHTLNSARAQRERGRSCLQKNSSTAYSIRIWRDYKVPRLYPRTTNF